MKSKKRKMVIYENGSVGFITPGNSIMLKAADGGDIKIVDEVPMPEGVDRKPPRLYKAVPHGKSWRVQEKDTEELVRDGVLTPEEGDVRDRGKSAS